VSENLGLWLNIGVTLLVVLVAYVAGSQFERRHFASILAREERWRAFPVISFEALPSDWKVGLSDLVTGSVVISPDYFKRLVAGLRGIVGGRIKTYEPLLERARREAVLRMIETAKQRGFDAVINLRLETSRLANAAGNGKGTTGVEMLAFGTAITLT
jgi:uncharacterized protein YbjQ (UPF0145 family)